MGPWLAGAAIFFVAGWSAAKWIKGPDVPAGKITWSGLMDGAVGSLAGSFFGGVLALGAAWLVYQSGAKARTHERIQEGLVAVAEACDEYVHSWKGTERVRRRVNNEKSNPQLVAAKEDRQVAYRAAGRVVLRVLPLTLVNAPHLYVAMEATWSRVRNAQHRTEAPESAAFLAQICRDWIADPGSAQRHRELAQQIEAEDLAKAANAGQAPNEGDPR